MARTDRDTGGWSTVVEAALVLALFIVLSPLLIVLLGVKIVRMTMGWREQRPDGSRRDATWGLFVSTGPG